MIIILLMIMMIDAMMVMMMMYVRMMFLIGQGKKGCCACIEGLFLALGHSYNKSPIGTQRVALWCYVDDEQMQDDEVGDS